MDGIRLVEMYIYMKAMQFVADNVRLVFREHKDLLVDVVFDRFEEASRQGLLGREAEAIRNDESLHEDYRETLVAKALMLVGTANGVIHVVRFGAKVHFLLIQNSLFLQPFF